MTYRVSVYLPTHPCRIYRGVELRHREAAAFRFDEMVYNQISAFGGLDTCWGHEVANAARVPVYDDDVVGVTAIIPAGTAITFERRADRTDT